MEDAVLGGELSRFWFLLLGVGDGHFCTFFKNLLVVMFMNLNPCRLVGRNNGKKKEREKANWNNGVLPGRVYGTRNKCMTIPCRLENI